MIRYALIEEPGLGYRRIRCPDCPTQIAESYFDSGYWVTELAIGEENTVRKPGAERDGILCFGPTNRERQIGMLPAERRAGKRSDRGRPTPTAVNSSVRGSYAADYGPIMAERFDTWCQACGTRLRVVFA